MFISRNNTDAEEHFLPKIIMQTIEESVTAMTPYILDQGRLRGFLIDEARKKIEAYPFDDIYQAGTASCH